MTHFLRGAGLSVTNKGFDQTTLQTFNTTSGALTNYMYHTTNTATRSSGSNDLTNVGIYVKASRAQLNYGIVVDSGSVGIGTVTPVPSAALDITSTTQGFLPPRLTTTQQGSIASPATGLVIYNTDSAALCHYNGSAWRLVGGTVYGGTYTPTGTAGANVDAVTPFDVHYTRVGSTVTFAGTVDIDITAAAGSAVVELSLPVASAFTATTDAAGVSLPTNVAVDGGYISGSIANDRLVLTVSAVSTATITYKFSGSYIIK